MIVITNQEEFDAFLDGLPVNEQGMSVISDEVTITEQADCRLTGKLSIRVSGSLRINGTLHVDGTLKVYVVDELRFNFISGTLYVKGELYVYVCGTIIFLVDCTIHYDGTIKIYGTVSFGEGEKLTVNGEVIGAGFMRGKHV